MIKISSQDSPLENYNLFPVVNSLIELTNEIITFGKSSRGSWCKKQLNILGIFPLKSGWKDDIIGNQFCAKDINPLIILIPNYSYSFPSNWYSYNFL